MAVLTMIIGPLLMFGTDGIFLLTKRFAGFVNIPIVALFAVGLFNKTVSGLAARIALLLHVILYFSIVWVFQVKVNFVYVMAALFVFDVVVMLVLGQFLKREPYEESKENKEGVDLTNWEHARVTVASLVLGLISLRLTFATRFSFNRRSTTLNFRYLCDLTSDFPICISQ